MSEYVLHILRVFETSYQKTQNRRDITVTGWFIFMVVIWSAAFLLVPIRQWKKLWSAGIFGLLISLASDTSLSSIGAFGFRHSPLNILGLPVPYWISYFAGGVIFAYFRPIGRWARMAYVFALALILWILEVIMIRLGYFVHLNWSLGKAYILNIGGFLSTFWFTDWAGLPYRQPSEKSASK